MSKYLFFFSLLFIPLLTFAKDFGREGHVFQIAEENLKEYLQKRLKALPEEEIKNEEKKNIYENEDFIDKKKFPFYSGFVLTNFPKSLFHKFQNI